MSSDDHNLDEEWERRELCSDGNCIGVIGPDGLCKECGRPGQGGSVPADTLQETATEPAADDPQDPAEPPEEAPAGEISANGDDDDDWSRRRLCPDGNCIGVIGPDGRCKECGRPAD
ncbi:MAG: hypothetical protein PVJ53_16585 [Desulfobacterales bacterium]|jgi:hypothetical protein